MTNNTWTLSLPIRWDICLLVVYLDYCTTFLCFMCVCNPHKYLFGLFYYLLVFCVCLNYVSINTYSLFMYILVQRLYVFLVRYMRPFAAQVQSATVPCPNWIQHISVFETTSIHYASDFPIRFFCEIWYGLCIIRPYIHSTFTPKRNRMFVFIDRIEWMLFRLLLIYFRPFCCFSFMHLESRTEHPQCWSMVWAILYPLGWSLGHSV